MAAVVFNNTKYRFLENELVDFADSDQRYYAMIGRSVPWNATDTPPNPDNSLEEERNFRLSSVSLKQIIDCSLVVPRNNWTSGSTYPAYNDNTNDNASNFHVITEELNVYICLRQAINTSTGAAINSTVQPNSTAVTPILYADGYVWKFLYNLGAIQSNRFLTANFAPVRFVDSADANSPAADIKQKEIQDAATAGQIAGFEIIEAGTGYDSATITIEGNGTGARAEAIVVGGELAQVRIEQDSVSTTTFYHGSGYEYAKATVNAGSQGSGGKVRVILAPKGGFGADPRKDLRSDAIMYNTIFSGTENGDFLVGQDFRQLGLLVNPLTTDSSRNAYGYDSAFTDETGLLLRTLYVDANLGISNSPTSLFVRDQKIKGATSGATAVLDDFDNTGSSTKAFYHQTEDTGFKSFQTGETINPLDSATGNTLSQSVTVLADSAAKADRMSGTMLYVDNRAATERETSQDEDLKIIIKL